MKKTIFLLVLFFCSVVGYGQFVNTQTIGSGTTLFKSKGGLASDSAFILLNNYADTTAANFSVASKYAGSFIRVDTSIYYRTLNPNKWNLFAKVGSTGTIVSISQGYGILNSPNPITTVGTITTDTTVIVSKSYFSNFNALNVKYADTSAMLTPYLRKSDTLTMLNPYLRKSDTSNMLDPYVRKTRLINTNAPLAGGGSLATDLTLVADTGRANAQLVSGGSLNQVKDSLVALISSSGGGTVLSVATTDGFGINSSVASPTTNPNITISVDTIQIATRYTTDSIAALKLNISDTSAMLGNYLRKTDTLTMLSPYLRKTDTLTMLLPYLRKTDTLTMLAPYLRKTDTLTMLSPYLRKTDTATMLSGYTRVNRFLDTTSVLRALINTKGTGTVTSVGLSLPSIFTVSGSPVTTSGTITASLANQNANLVFASPTSGSPATPTFRSLVAADLPSLTSVYVPYTGATNNVDLGLFSLTANALKAKGTLGSELVTNGDFATNLNGWSGGNWSWSANGALHSIGNDTSLVQSSTVATVGTTYKITYDVVNRTSGLVIVQFGGVWGGTRASSGSYTEYITATANDSLFFKPDSTFDGAIDNVSIKELITTDSSYFETKTEFRKSITIFDRIDLPDGLPISIGYNAMPFSTRGFFNVPSSNIAIGNSAGYNTTTGHITAVGYRAGEANTDGVLTAFGKWAGLNNTTGHATMVGNAAGRSNTTADGTYIGDEAGAANQTGQVTVVGYYAGNANVNQPITAVGYLAAQLGVSAANITAVGQEALYNNNTSNSSAFGHQAGYNNTTGIISSFGYRSLFNNTSGQSTAFGVESLLGNTTGNATAFGNRAGYSNTTGNITAIGDSALYANQTSNSVAVGFQSGFSNTTGRLTALGYKSSLRNTTGNLISIGFSSGEGNNSANEPVTDTAGILIGDFTGRNVASGTQLINYIGIGNRTLIDKSNQVIIGNNNIIETNFYGETIINGLGSLLNTFKVKTDTIIPKSSDSILIGNGIGTQNLRIEQGDLIIGSNSGFGIASANKNRIISIDNFNASINYPLFLKDVSGGSNSDSVLVKTSNGEIRKIPQSSISGTVTSIATNNGTGITGGTITTTGTLAIDTLNISTRLWRQKGVDSVMGQVSLKLNISDTSDMLNPYLRKSDTATMLSRLSFDRVLQNGNSTGRGFTAGNGIFNDSVRIATTVGDNPVFRLQVGDGGGDVRSRFRSSTQYALSVARGTTGGGYNIGATESSTSDLLFSNTSGVTTGVLTHDGALTISSRFTGTSIILNKDSVTTSSSGSVLPLGIDTATGNIVKGASISSGTYTPTITNGSGVSGISAAVCSYTRIGNIVSVGVAFSITSSSAGGSYVTVTLPFASTFTTVSDVTGTVAVGTGSSIGTGNVSSFVSSTEATIHLPTSGGANIQGTFMYIIK